MEALTLDEKGGAAVVIYTFDGSTHLAEGSDNALHGALSDRFVPGQGDAERLGREKAGEKTGRCPAIAAVQHPVRLFKPVHSVSENQHPLPSVFDGNSHALKARDGGKAVCPLEKSVNLGKTLGNGAEHDAAVGDGFVAGNGDFAP
ncbi:unknown [Clostridium sp. CAG:149]|nr:unknown [Clostridium sp. CAG:149]